MKKIVTLIFFLLSTCSYSQDLMTGAISFTHISALTYQFTAVVISDTNTRTSFIIDYGNGDRDTVPVNARGADGVYEYFIHTYYTYPSAGVYTIFVEADYLVDSINNLPNSGTTALYLDAQLTIGPISSYDNSPVCTQSITDSGSCCNKFSYNVGAFDSDGDSLSYSLISIGIGYSFAGATIGSATGDLTFTPSQAGRYLFKIEIAEWRKISSVYYNIGYVSEYLFLNISSISGLQTLDSKPYMKLYPNPATDLLTIYIPSLHNDGFENVSITNVLGQFIYQSAITNQQTGIEISSLSPGIYFVQVADEKEIWVGRFEKR